MDGNDPVEARLDLAARFYDTFNFFTEQFASKHRKENPAQARGTF